MKNKFFWVCAIVLAQYANAQPVTPRLPAKDISVAQLGKAPLLSGTKTQFVSPQPPLPRALNNPTINPLSRSSVVTAYLNDFLPLFNVPSHWTGSVNNCNAGQTNVAYTEATINAVNYFRAMVGLPAVAHNHSLDTAAQQAALMMIANDSLDHTPPSSWTCYTAAGAGSAGKSNLYLIKNNASYIPAPRYIRGYIIDSGNYNQAVGHRRWILYPKAAAFGTGAAGPSQVYYQGYPLNAYSNVLDILSSPWQSRPTTPEIIAWPPRGYVPQQLLTEYGNANSIRWSFSLNNNTPANYTNATVTMVETTTGGSSAINTNVIYRDPKPNSFPYGDSSLVWETPNLVLTPGDRDRTFSITVSNISNASQGSYNYTVTVVDPTLAQEFLFDDSFED